MPVLNSDISCALCALSTKIDIKNLEILSDYKEPKEAPSKAAGGSGKIKMSKSAGISTEINLLGWMNCRNSTGNIHSKNFYMHACLEFRYIMCLVCFNLGRLYL